MRSQMVFTVFAMALLLFIAPQISSAEVYSSTSSSSNGTVQMGPVIPSGTNPNSILWEAEGVCTGGQTINKVACGRSNATGQVRRTCTALGGGLQNWNFVRSIGRCDV